MNLKKWYYTDKWSGNVKFPKKFWLGFMCQLVAKKGSIDIGENFVMGDFSSIKTLVPNKITIGQNVTVGMYTTILGSSHGKNRADLRGSIEIGDDVYIGSYVLIMPGVKIGKGATIGAYSYVNKDVPAGVFVVGQPAKVKK